MISCWKSSWNDCRSNFILKVNLKKQTNGEAPGKRNGKTSTNEWKRKKTKETQMETQTTIHSLITTLPPKEFDDEQTRIVKNFLFSNHHKWKEQYGVYECNLSSLTIICMSLLQSTHKSRSTGSWHSRTSKFKSDCIRCRNQLMIFFSDVLQNTPSTRA